MPTTTRAHATLAAVALAALITIAAMTGFIHTYGDATTLNSGVLIGHSGGIEITGNPGIFTCDGQC